MKRIAWLTDIHLNFVPYHEFLAFVDSVAKHNPDAVLITGDTGEADSVIPYLDEMAGLLERNIYFVLGNHDFYSGSISETRLLVDRMCRQNGLLTWLSSSEVIELTPAVGLIGHDSWPDGRLGDYEGSDLLLNDHFLIEEFLSTIPSDGASSPEPEKISLQQIKWLESKQARQARWHIMKALADQAAEHFEKVLPAALQSYRHVFALMHAPPFREASWYKGKISSDEWLPHFACKAVGDILYDTMKNRPECELTVLCGHTHGKGQAQILDNLTVHTGGATYCRPEVQNVFELE